MGCSHYLLLRGKAKIAIGTGWSGQDKQPMGCLIKGANVILINLSTFEEFS